MILPDSSASLFAVSATFHPSVSIAFLMKLMYISLVMIVFIVLSPVVWVFPFRCIYYNTRVRILQLAEWKNIREIFAHMLQLVVSLVRDASDLLMCKKVLQKYLKKINCVRKAACSRNGHRINIVISKRCPFYGGFWGYTVDKLKNKGN